MDMRARMQQKQGAGRLAGMYALKDGCGMTLEIPSSTKALSHPTLPGVKVCTVMRIFPQFNADGTPKPMRNFRQLPGSPSATFENNDFSDWLYAEEGVRFAGCADRGDAFTAFMRTDKSGDNGPTPFKHFWSTMYSAIKADKVAGIVFPRAWQTWIEQKGALPNAGWIPLMQGMVFNNYGREYTNQQTGQPEPRVPCVVLGGKSILDSFCDRLNRRRPGSTQAATSDADFELPDLCGERGLKVQIIFHPQQGRTLSYFDVEPVADCPVSVPFMQSKVKPWDQVIRLMTDAEQVGTLLNHFPVEAISYAFKSSPFWEMLNADQKSAWDRFKQQSFAPGQQAPAQYGIPPQNQQPQAAAPAAPAYQPQAQQAPSWQQPFPAQLPANVTAAAAVHIAPVSAQTPAWQPQPAPQAQVPNTVTLPSAAPASNYYPGAAPAPAAQNVPAWSPQPAAAPPSQPIGDPTVDQQGMAAVAARLRGVQTQFDPSRVPPPPAV